MIVILTSSSWLAEFASSSSSTRRWHFRGDAVMKLTRIAREHSLNLGDPKTLPLASTKYIHLQTLVEAVEMIKMVKTMEILEVLEVLEVLERVELVAMLKESRCGVPRGEVSGPTSKGIPNQMRKCGLYLSAHHRRFRLTVLLSKLCKLEK